MYHITVFSTSHHLILIPIGIADLLEAELLEGLTEFGVTVVTLLVEGWEDRVKGLVPCPDG